ncbi:hypothetical protein ACHAW6_013895, partial [Cyclotella cf. meneghiniana]
HESVIERTRYNFNSEYLTSKVFILFFCKSFLHEAGRLSNSIDAMDPLSFQNGFSSKRNLGYFAFSLGGGTLGSSTRRCLEALILARRLRGTVGGLISDDSDAAVDSVSFLIFSRSLD